MRVTRKEYLQKPLRAHIFLADVSLHDVWAIRLNGGGDGRTLGDFQALFTPESLQRANLVVGVLFKLRWVLGSLFGRDEEGSEPPASSYVHRLTDSELTRSLDEPGRTGSDIAPFRTVYSSETEALYELINATGHLFLLMAMESAANGYTVYWAIYAKKTGWLTPLYMTLIDPFRRYLVYPAVIGMVERTWASRYS